MSVSRLKDGAFILKGVRLSYPHFFTPSSAVASAKKKYSGNFLLVEDSDVSVFQNEVDTLIKSELKGKRPDASSIALREDDSGVSFVKAANVAQPILITADMTKVTDEDDSPFYPGCFVNAKISLKVNTRKGEQSVYAVLHTVQFAGHGDRLDTGMTEAEAVVGFDTVDEDDDDNFLAA